MLSWFGHAPFILTAQHDGLMNRTPPGDPMHTSTPTHTVTRRFLMTSAAALSLALPLAAQAQGKTELLVYTALEADQIKAYKEGCEKVHPHIELKFVRDSTGIVTAKLLAEKANPQADVVWGLAATSLKLLDKEGMLLPYAPKGLEAIKHNMRDPRVQPTWVGMNVWSSAM